MKKVKLQYENIHITESGVRYWDIGQEMELIYIIETTRNDEDVKNDYSNIIQKECHSLNELFKIFNEWQKAGYKNIQIVTNVKHNNETIIEDVSECLELSVNSAEMNNLKDDSKQLQKTREQVATYDGFIKHYKAEKAFEKYLKERNAEKNKDQNGLYWYEMRLRPLSIGSQPNGFIQIDDTKGRHGIIAYNRPLTQNEINEYDLSLWEITSII
jgi:hypothetical protein